MRTERQPRENVRVFVERRKRVLEKLGDAVLIVCSAPEHVRNGLHHFFPYRPDSNLYYLTGFEEPDSILVMRAGSKPQSALFVRRRNPERETWDGYRFGPDRAQGQFQIDACYPIDEFGVKAQSFFKDAQRLFYRSYKNPHADGLVKDLLLAHQNSLGRSGLGLLPVYDADEFLSEFRIIKTDLDLLNIRQACAISADAQIDCMKYIKPGMNEKEICGYFGYQIRKRGADGEGYNPIVAGGPNACTLHYVFNDQNLRDGELVLIDAGAEYNYFTGDITRTYPINGKFTKEQAEVYSAILQVQKHIIEMVKPGILFSVLHSTAAEMLTDVMLELGLFSGRRDDLIAANHHRKYYPHGLGHYLGMDVHDVGRSRTRNGQQLELQPGMLITVEPGLYIPLNDQEAVEKYRGIGIRIEDDVLVTDTGCEVLTRDCPKEISDLEKIIGSNYR